MADAWIDIAAHPAGGFVRAIGEAGAVRVEHDGRLLWRQPVETDFLRWLRIAVSPSGTVAAVGQGGEGAAWLVTHGADRALAITFGTSPVALRYEGETLHTYVCTPGDYVPLLVDGIEVLRTHAVEGIRDVLADGTIVLAQPTAEGHFQGRNFGQFTRRDGWIVGQSGYTVACLHEASNHFFTAHHGILAEGVHFATQHDGSIAVCALTEHGGWSEVFAPPYPPNEPIVTAPPVTPPKPAPPVVPQPNPEPKPMPYDVNAPQTWTDAELSRRVDAEIALARSTDAPQYWKDMIRAASRGADWGYWVHRIQTGDGVGKAGPAPAPAPPPAPAPSIDPALLEQLAEVIGAVKLLQAEMLRAGSRIALKTDNGHYLCAEGGGGGDLNASRESAGGWETFTVEAQ